MVAAGKNPEDYLVRAVVRATDLLELVRQNQEKGASLTWLSEKSGLGKPTVFRLIRTLMEVGLVEAVAGKNAYRLGVQCVVLGQTYLEKVDILREARSVLAELRDVTSETVHLGVLDGEGRVVYLEKLEGNHAVGVMKSRVGRAVPAYCTGIGKALLAFSTGQQMPQVPESGLYERFTATTITSPEALVAELRLIENRGYSMDLGEHEEGVQCVATPIYDSTGRAIAALSVTGPAERLPLQRLEGELLLHARNAASEVSRRMGWTSRDGTGAHR